MNVKQKTIKSLKNKLIENKAILAHIMRLIEIGVVYIMDKVDDFQHQYQ